jgi:hypothetical protein
MNVFNRIFITISVTALLVSCEKNESDPSINDLCAVAPIGWESEIIKDNFNENDIPKNTPQPIIIIKYVNQDKKFTYFAGGTEIHPSLKLNLYPITKKGELIAFIKSQQIFSWCIPIYYGETKEYFIITSPCFINEGSFTSDANSCINDLHTALKSIISVKDYGLIGQ